jgi:phosphoglycerol transferase MdoB-like AlkP superfamily enzyme
LTFEPSLTEQAATADFLLVVAALIVLGIALLWLGARKKLPVVFDPESDLLQLGLMASLWRYGEEEQERCCDPFPYDSVQPVEKILKTLPNLVVVQSESFFDVRDLYAGIRPEILQEFDSLKTVSACSGKLNVPAWGANTVRTEFAFISGLDAEALGVHRFNPYRKLARQGVPTLAGFLRNLGYRTVCVHPYPAGFYNRDKVFPLLGFDEFMDIRSFEGVDKTGPYIGDVDLAEKVCALLGDSSDQPIFVFVITMENHGPLHWEKVLAGDVERLYSSPPPDDCDDLTIYLRHLRNADRMVGMLRDGMEALPGAGWLCWFGDHVPIMASVYEVMGMPDGQTDYMIWRKGGLLDDGVCADMEVEHLGLLLLQKMGLVM